MHSLQHIELKHKLDALLEINFAGVLHPSENILFKIASICERSTVNMNLQFQRPIETPMCRHKIV